MLQYAISDRMLFNGGEPVRLQHTVEQAATLAREGVDHFQIREKDLAPDTLLALTCAVRDAVRATGAPMQVVLNGPRRLAERAGVAWHCTATNATEHAFSCSVHTLDEVAQCRSLASLLLFAPVFGKTVADATVQPAAGLEQLRFAVDRARGTPVLALGGVTVRNASSCLEAGAAGIAGIRLFHREPRGAIR